MPNASGIDQDDQLRLDRADQLGQRRHLLGEPVAAAARGRRSTSGRQKSPPAMPEQAADDREHDALGQELLRDVAPLGAQGAADADLAGPLGDGGQHDVHDADAADDQRDRGDQAQEHA